MSFIVKEVTAEQKSVQEIEQELITKHEQESTKDFSGSVDSGEVKMSPKSKSVKEDVSQNGNEVNVKVPKEAKSSKGAKPDTPVSEDSASNATSLDTSASDTTTSNATPSNAFASDVPVTSTPIGTPIGTPIDEDNIVLSKIKSKYNKDYSSIDDFFNEVESLRNNKVDISEDIQALMKFKKETNRPIEDFIKLNRDYSKETPQNVIAEFMALENPELTQDEILFEMDNKYSFDTDLDDDKDIKKKQIALKRDFSDALKYFNKQKEAYNTPLASSVGNISDADKTAFEEFKKYTESSKENEDKGKKLSDFFMQKTKELFSDDFKGFGIKVNDKEFLYKPDESSKLLQQQSDVSNFISKHLDAEGKIKDAAQYHKALSAAMNPDAFAKYFYEQGVADSVTDSAKASKNIDMGKVVPARESTNKGGFNVAVVDEGIFDNGLKFRWNKH